MKLSRVLFLSLCISIALVGCREDETGFVPSDDTEIMSMVDLTGLITDPDGNPVSGASVQYESVEAITDNNGFYNLQNVEASDKHASLQVTKSGYFAGSRTFRTSKAGTVFHRVTLVPFGEPLRLAGGKGSVANDLVSLDFPENAVMDESTGTVYTGDVEVFIKHIGTDEFSMPGDLTSINENDELEILLSYGMVFVELYGEDGRKLNVAEGMTANMTYEIPADLLATAPQSIKMWSYDYEAGVWREEGEATREGNRWVGEVSHFSCWNFDLNVPSVLVNGQIIQNNGVQSQFYVTVLNDDNKGGRGSANADGSFSGRVEAGVPLELTIQYLEVGCEAIVYQETIGPFNQDTDLGDIMVNTDNIPSNPLAWYTISQDDNQANKYSFTNASTVRKIADTSFSSSWDFGGDGTSTEANPTHTFSTGGLRDITLTITAADGEVATVTQTIDVGEASNKYGRVTDTKDDDTGELRLEINEFILTGRMTFMFRLSEGPSMDIADGFISLAGTATTGDFVITEVRLKDNTPHEFREGASDATLAASAFPMGEPDVWVPVEISWNADGVTFPTYTVTIAGQLVITDAISTTNGGSGDVEDHLAAVVNGAMNFQWKYASNAAVSDGFHDVDNIVIYSSDSGTETIVFEDDFEGRTFGDNLNSDYDINSPYGATSSDASVGEDF